MTSYSPIEDYAALGDGRTVALVGRGGSIDWLSLPDLDSPSVFGALLDASRGGRFELVPDASYMVERRYRHHTNVLESTFRTSEGTVRVTDAMTLPGGDLAPAREVVRRVEGLSGAVTMSWRVAPRFGYGAWPTRVGWRGGVPVASARSEAVALRSWDAGTPDATSGAITGRFTSTTGSEALLVLAAAHGEPLVMPDRNQAIARLDLTGRMWSTWAAGRDYHGVWRESVLRSALALKLLVYAPSGAVAAAATTSLPESLGGERNWDYRFSWVRDSAFVLRALLNLGCTEEAEAFFWWLMHASQLTRPHVQVLYRLDGGARAPERTLDLEGYEGSKPVRIGNGAVDQVQLDIYGDLVQTAWEYAETGHHIDRDIAHRLSGIADFVSRAWHRPDAGIWEVRSEARHFTHSKMMCWIALDRACRMADAGHLPARGAPCWRQEAARIREFIEQRCWSRHKQSYVRSADTEELDASVLLGVLFEYGGPPDRLTRTVDAIRRELASTPYVDRYHGEDGLAGSEGAFLACSFWLAEALARTGRHDDAVDLFEALLPLGNDVGLYAEEIDRTTGRALGNFPQALTHLALISAAITLTDGQGA